MLTEAQSWVYSTLVSQKIWCNDDRLEDKIEINGTCKIKLNENCKLTTPNITLTTQQQLSTQYVHVHLPDFNLTLVRKDTDKQNMKLSKQARLESIIKEPELTKLSISLDEISKNLDDNEESIFRSKYVMYLLGSSTIILIASGISLNIMWIKNKKQITST